MKILAAVAHPDDEVLGCGATLCRLAGEGHDVAVVIVAEGLSSRFPRRAAAPAEALGELKDRAREAAAVIGVGDVSFFDLPDNRLDTVPLLDIVKRLEGLVEELRPEMIFTHSAGDLNVDHGAVHRAVLTAARPTDGCTVREIHAFEIPSSTDWAFGQFGSFRPQTFFDVRKTVDRKLEALQVYSTEVREHPHPRSPEAVRASALRWGAVAGVPWAEAFETIRRLV